MPTLLSLFDGSGGFPLAGALCGITPIAASEIEPYPIAVTKSRFPSMKHLGDISKINGAEIEPVDIITFGSPCQDLSVAGKRAGLKHSNHGDDETTRSGLFMEAVRIIKEMRLKTNGKYPRFAVWENVPGAFSSNKGEDFRIVLEEIIKIVEPSAVMPEVPQKGWAYADSYCGDGWSLAYRVLDAQYWGVPQRRRRIYLVADFGGECAREILFERKGLRGYFTQGRTPWKATAKDVEGSVGTDDRERTYGVVTKGNGDAFISNERHTSLATGGGQAGQGYPCVAYEISSVESTGIIDNIGGQAEYGKISEVNGTLRAGTQGAIAYVVEQVNDDKNFVDVELEVAVRKYEVDTERLSECLRTHKGKWTNKEIAEALDKPLTLVEHWFRKDKYFAIPDPDVWFDLKKLLGIETTEFDEAVMEFEYVGGNYDMRNRIHYGTTSPTLTCECGNVLYLLPAAIENHPNDSRVKIDESGMVQSLTGRMGTGGGNVPLVMEEKSRVINLNKGDVQSKTILDPKGIATPLYAGECRGGGECYVMEPRAIYTHPQNDTWTFENENKVQTLSASMGMGGGNTPLVMEQTPFCKSRRAKSPDDATTWKDGKVANTLNTFDLGEVRTNELVVENKPVYCLQGNGIDRADTAGCNGKGWCENVSYTLNTIDRPAVVYAVDQGGGKSSVNVRENQSPTLTCTHDGSPAVAYQDKIGSLCTRDYKGVGSQYVSEDKLIVEKKPLGLGIQSSSGIGAVGEDVMPCLINGDNPGWQNGVMAVKPRYVVRRLTPTECARLQGFADRWGDIDTKTELTDEEYRFWLDVRNTHAAINGRQTKEYTKAQMLTWYNKLLTDSAEYKMWGNGIALPCALYVMQGIEDALQCNNAQER